MTDESIESPSHEMTAADVATQTFLEHRRLLFSVTYNLLGSVADTEEVLQETWLAWSRESRRLVEHEIDNPRAYLVRVAVNRALAQQKVLNRRRETYFGPWLPEPVVTDAGNTPDVVESAMQTESISIALLVVLETLTPLERAVFVLNEAFGYAHTEIADILDRKPDAVRQLAHRARKHVQARRPRYRARPEVQREATERFLAAAIGGDLTRLMEILAPDVIMWADGGGKAPAVAAPLHGRDRVARLIFSFSSRSTESFQVRHRQTNGDASILMYDGPRLVAMLVLDVCADGSQVEGIYGITNPDKLARVS